MTTKKPEEELRLKLLDMLKGRGEHFTDELYLSFLMVPIKTALDSLQEEHKAEVEMIFKDAERFRNNCITTGMNIEYDDFLQTLNTQEKWYT